MDELNMQRHEENATLNTRKLKSINDETFIEEIWPHKLLKTIRKTEVGSNYIKSFF